MIVRSRVTCCWIVTRAAAFDSVAVSGDERVHAERADAEEVLDSAADSTRNRFGKQRRRAVVLRAARLRTQPAFLARAAEREQRHNIRVGKRRIGAIVQSEMAGRPGKIDRDLILVDDGNHLDVQGRVETERIREIDVTARELKIVSTERHRAAEQVDVPEQHGAVPSAAQVDVAIHLDVRAAPFDARPGSGPAFHVERQVLKKGRGGGRAGRGVRGRGEKRRHVHALRKKNALAPARVRRPAPRRSFPESRSVPPASQLIPAGYRMRTVRRGGGHLYRMGPSPYVMLPLIAS